MTQSLSSLKLSLIRTDGGTQARAVLDADWIESLADRLDELPPVVVFYDGAAYWLGDGFHRASAHQRAGRKHIICDVRQGTRRDAILFSVGCNAPHDRGGLRRTNADKRRAVETLLRDAEWASESNRWIAERCGVSEAMVRLARGEQRGELSAHGAQISRTVHRGDTSYTMDMGELTARAFAALPEEEQVRVLQTQEEEARAEEARAEEERQAEPARPQHEDDGRRLVSERLPLLTVQLLDGHAGEQRLARADMLEVMIRGWKPPRKRRVA